MPERKEILEAKIMTRFINYNNDDKTRDKAISMMASALILENQLKETNRLLSIIAERAEKVSMALDYMSQALKDGQRVLDENRVR